MTTKLEQSTDYISRTSREYSIYTCESRAIPKASDGLKDAQRKALWVIRNKAEKVKTISLAGEMIQSGLYVHGDGPAADAISGLAAPYLNNIPFIYGKGQFGSLVDPKGIGAPRYTYVRRNRAAQELMFKDLDIVPLKENYDGSALEPMHFLPIVPTVLLNGISGIAVGYSTDILPHKLDDLIKACIAVLDNKKIKSLVPYYNQYNLDVKNIEGSSWEFRGIVDKVDSSTARILEVPPDIGLERLKSKLDDLEDNNSIKSYIDKSTDNVNITVKFKKGQIKTWSNEKIVNYLKLKSRKTERIIVLDWESDAIRQYDCPEDLVKDFVKWRLKWYKRRYENLLANAENDLRFYLALEECFNKKLPQKILSLINKDAVRQETVKITKKFNLTDDQIEKIISMPSYRWSQDSLNEIQDKIKQLNSDIAEYTKILSDEKEIIKVYKSELTELAKIKF